jgi:magnesium/cobalt transport protein CorA
MHGLLIDPKKKAHPVDTFPASGGLLWLDLIRSEAECDETLNQALSINLHERHLADLSNVTHPPFFDGTAEYDLVIMRGFDHRSELDAPRTRTIGFLITHTAIASIRDADDETFDDLRKRLLACDRRAPDSTAALLHLLLNELVDELLNLIEPLSLRISDLQQRLLDDNDPFDDWRALMLLRSRLRWLSGRMEEQRSVLTNWRNETLLQLDENAGIRFNDLDNHLARVERHAEGLQNDIDGLINVHFAAAGQRTNKLVQFLAVISAIFLPLNLIAGVFGMNFTSMPLLQAAWGGWIAIGAMVLLGLVLWQWFRRNRWF